MKYEKKKVMIAGIAAVFVFMIVVIITCSYENTKGGHSSNQDMDFQSEENQEREDGLMDDKDQQADQENKKGDSVDTSGENIEGDVPSNTIQEESSNRISDGQSDVTNADQTSDTKTKQNVSDNGNSEIPQTTIVPDYIPTEEKDTKIEFPYRIPGTTLVVEQINPYDGIFLEDRSDSEIENVAAVVVKNTGNQCAEYINITLYQGDRILTFIGSLLVPGGQVVIMETNAAAYEDGAYQACTADVAVLDHMELSEDVLKVEEDAKNGLVVTNLSNKNIPCVRIFYKFYMKDIDVYVGGITYNAKVINLGPGRSQKIVPSHYSIGDSKVLMVKTYDESDT